MRRTSFIKPAVGIAFLAAASFPAAIHVAQGNLTPLTPDENFSADAIVVFAGDNKRIDRGYTMLSGGEAPYLLHSGPGQREIVYSAELLSEYKLAISYDNATDTMENASETAKWINEKGHSRILLVTSDYHMRRSYFELRNALPDDVEIRSVSVEGTTDSEVTMGELLKLSCRMYETLIPAVDCKSLRDNTSFILDRLPLVL